MIYAYGILNLVESSLKLRSDVQWTFVGHTFAGTESNHEECSLSGDRHAEDNRSWHLEDGVSGSVSVTYRGYGVRRLSASLRAS